MPQKLPPEFGEIPVEPLPPEFGEIPLNKVATPTPDAGTAQLMGNPYSLSNIGNFQRPPEPEGPSKLGQLWSAISTPLTDAPSRFAKTIGDYIDAPSLERSPTMAALRGFGAGALQGIGDMASSMTSPIDLTAAALTGGESLAAKAGMRGAAGALGTAGRVASALPAIHGAGNVLSPDSTMGQRGQGLMEIAGSLAGVAGPGGRAKTIAGRASDVAPTVGAMGDTASRLKSAITPKATAVETTASRLKAATEGKEISPGIYDPYSKHREAPVGTKLTMSPADAAPGKVKDLAELGYHYEGLSEDGKVMMTKTAESPKVGEVKAMPDASTMMDVLNLPRALMASIDLSAPLRQGLGLIHKKEFWKALPDMLKAWGSEDAYNQIQKSILKDDIFKKRVSTDGRILPSFAEDSGLALTSLDNMSKREESFMSKFAEKVPGVRRSERAYTIFLNKLRADTFKSMTNDFGTFAGINTKNNMKVSRDIASFVNAASGRGGLGPLESSANALSTALFSPRLIASRLQMMAGARHAFNPTTYMSKGPSVRKEYLKSLAAMAAVTGTFTGLMKMAGAEVETDPASSDWMKTKIGNTRIDPYGGFQQPIVLMQRMLPDLDLSGVGGPESVGGGRMKSTTTGEEYSLSDPDFGRSTRADVLGRYVRSKTNPIINFGWGLLAGKKEMSGKSMNLTTLNPMENAIAQRFIPMLLQDMYELYNEQTTPPAAKIMAGFLSGVGMSEQTYGGEQEEELTQ